MRDGSQTKARIERSALKLFVKQGIRETTIKDIARDAGVSEGALYRHYASKEDLAWTLFSRNTFQFVGELELLIAGHKNLKDQLKAMLNKVFKFYDEDPYSFRYLLLTEHGHQQRVTPDMPHTFNVLKETIANGMKRGEIPKQDPMLVTSMVFGLVRGVAMSKVVGRFKGKLSNTTDAVYAAAWRILKH